MKDQDKTREELVSELLEMREKIAQLETSLVTRKQREESGQEAVATSKAMIEAFDGLIYMCSSNYEVEFMNERFIQRTGHNPVGEKCYRALHDRDEICSWCVNEKVQLGETVRWEVQSPRDDRWYYVVNTPVHHRDGTISKMSLTQDITDRKRSENVLLARLRLVEYSASHSLDELLKATLDEVEVLTDSSIGFYHFVETDQRTLSLQAWSTRTLREMCTAEGKGLHYDLDEAGVWADCVRERKPVIHNDYFALPHHRGMPAGHANVIRELVVPVFRGDRIVAIVGVGNKPVDYDASDIETVSLLADLAWDIAERKQTEERLRLLDFALDHVREAAFLIDEHARFHLVNEESCRKLGYTRSELLGLSVSDVDPDFPMDRWLSHWEYLKTQGSIVFDGRHKTKDGHVFPVEINANYFEYGGQGYNLALVRDITERTRNEAEMRTILARLDALINATPDIVYFKDLDSRLLIVNKAYEEFVGKPKEDIVGRSFRQLLPSDLAEQASEGDQEVLRRLETVRQEQQTTDKQGETIFFDAIKFPILDDLGRVIGLAGITRDVTHHREMAQALCEARDRLEERVRERTSEIEKTNEGLRREIAERQKAETALRRSEELFRAIFQSAQDLIFIKDLAGRYVKVNPAAERVFGLPASEIIGLKSKDLVDPRSSKAIKEYESRVLSGETVEGERTLTIKGATYVFHSIGVPLRDPDGTIIGTCSISRDITDRRMVGTSPQVSSQGYHSKPMRATLSAISHAAASDVIVLFQGESGSGKDYAARRVHDLSCRADGPFFSINCAALPHELAESELFGHEAGAFTGAVKRKKGLLELAEGGTLLLNEIGELPLSLQAKLLTFLDTRSFMRVGGQRHVTVNARLIAATHRNLHKEVEQKRFVEPLFHRLNVFPIRVPPLRERIEDLPVLVEEIMAKLGSQLQLSEMPVIDANVIAALRKYEWPGNVRELRNVLERSLMLWTSGPFHIDLPHSEQPSAKWSYLAEQGSEQSLKEVLDEVTFSVLEHTLHATGGNKKEAADRLGISRDALYRYLKKMKKT